MARRERSAFCLAICRRLEPPLFHQGEKCAGHLDQPLQVGADLALDIAYGLLPEEDEVAGAGIVDEEIDGSV